MANLTIEEISGDSPQEPQQETAFELLDFQKAKVRIDNLIGQWSEIRECACKKRKERKIKLDTEQLRKSGAISPDELLIPVRVIDNNISRELADAMQFLNASQRLAYFRCVDDPTVDTRQLESDFTKGLTYKGWYKQFKRHFDGAAMHGWDCIEVMYNANKPLRVSYEHCGHERVMFNLKVEDIQDSELVLRQYEVSGMRLESFVQTFAFDKLQVDRILKAIKDAQKDNEVVCIYKVYFKYNNCVYVAWYSKEHDVSDWLKKPEKLMCGILEQQLQPPSPTFGAALGGHGLESTLPALPAPPMFIEKEVHTYPIFLFVYRDDEEAAITEHKGRGFYDLPNQEAQTALTSAFINGNTRASKTYAAAHHSLAGDDTAAHKLEELTLEQDSILPIPIEFHNQPYPDPTMLAAVQLLDADSNKQTGKLATSVSNRKDSRKTAKELGVAEKEETKLTSVSQADYSEFLREIFSFSWQIVQSQAIAGNIIFLPKEQPPQQMALPGMEQPPQNDIAIISKHYDVRAAGEIDVIQKQEQIQSIQQDWPVFQNTPIAGILLEEYIRLRYPLIAEKLIQAMRMGDMGKALVAGLVTALEGALQPEELASLDPNAQQQLIQLVTTAKSYVAQGTPGQPNQQAAPGQTEGKAS